MTDEQIKKALECCSKDNVKECDICPYNEKETNTYCANDLIKDTFALTNRQKAEIERLQNALIGECMLSNCSREDEIKAEAYKELAEKLEEKSSLAGSILVGKNVFYNLIKELTEDNK